MNKKELKEKKENNIELVMLYFAYRNIFKFGFQSYKIFKNLIIHITRITDKIYIRNIFDTMLSRKIFKVKFHRKSRFYHYNPYNINETNLEPKKDENDKYVVSFK
jgi:hypothetical protein